MTVKETLRNLFVLYHPSLAAIFIIQYSFKYLKLIGIPGWRSGLAPALAQGAILETQDRIPRRAPGAWSLLLPLPMSLPLSLSLCDYHK